MHGAMHGLAEGLDADSAYLPPEEAKLLRERRRSRPPARPGIELTRLYYLRVDRRARRLAGREGGAADRATSSGRSTASRRARCRCTRARACCAARRARTVSLLVIRGNVADPHEVDAHARGAAGARRDRPHAGRDDRATCASRRSGPRPPRERGGEGRRADEERRRRRCSSTSATRRRAPTSRASPSPGSSCRAARSRFKQMRGAARQPLAAAAGDGAITLPAVVLVDAARRARPRSSPPPSSGNQRATTRRRAHRRAAPRCRSSCRCPTARR